MTRKKKRRSSVVEFGNGPTKVRIYSMNRKDGYPEFTLAWKEGGRRRVRSLSDMEEARMVAQQITVRLSNGWTIGDEATKRALELLRHCEQQTMKFGVTLAAAIDEWVSARGVVEGITLSDAVRFYQANRTDLLAVRTTAQVAAEFVKSRATSGVSAAYVSGCRLGLKGLGPVSRNGHRRNIVTCSDLRNAKGISTRIGKPPPSGRRHSWNRKRKLQSSRPMKSQAYW